MVVSNELLDDLPKILWTHDDEGLKEVKMMSNQDIQKAVQKEIEKETRKAERRLKDKEPDLTKRKQMAREEAEDKVGLFISKKYEQIFPNVHSSMRKYLDQNNLRLIKMRPSKTLIDYIGYHGFPLKENQSHFGTRREQAEDEKAFLRTLDIGAIDHAQEVMRVLKPKGTWLTTDLVTGQKSNHPEVLDHLLRFTQSLVFLGKTKEKNAYSNINAPQVISAVEKSGGKLVHAEQQAYFAQEHAPTVPASVIDALKPFSHKVTDSNTPHFFTFEFRKRY